MKKIYLLAATALFAFTANAQFEDDFETYSTGDISSQSPLWATWGGINGTDEDAEVSSAEVSNGSNSINIVDGNDMLLFFEQTGGQYTWKYNAYISGDSSGLIGLMSESNFTFGLIFYHNLDGNGPAFAAGVDLVSQGFSIPTDTWATFTWKMDLDADTVEIDIDGTQIYAGDLFLGGVLDSVNIWSDVASDTPSTNFFMDEIRFVDGILGVDDFSSDVFSVFPNPVVNELNIKSASVIDNITIYDVLGKQVLSVNPDAISPSVDMSALSSGAYLVNITIGNATKTVKVLK